MLQHFISATCGGEYCGMCWKNGIEYVPATHKIGEEIPSDTPLIPQIQSAVDKGEMSEYFAKSFSRRHNLTAYVCCLCFADIFGSAAKEMCGQPAIDNRAEKFK